MVPPYLRWLVAVAGTVLYTAFGVAAVLLVLGWFAPPPVEHQPLDPASPASTRAADAAGNLRATDYTYEMVVERWRDGIGPETTTYHRVEIDNRARAYYSVLWNPAGAVNRSRQPVRFFSDGLTGHRRIPAGPTWAYAMPYERGQWVAWEKLRYAPKRNALSDVDRLRDAETTVLAADDTDLVVRVTNRSVAAAVGHPRLLQHDGANWTATLTVRVDRQRGVVERSVFRYHDPARDVRVRTTWRVTAVGSTHVQRPPGTLPPGPIEALYRLDLGIRTLDDLTGPPRAEVAT